jgi:Rrf2 family cysteine metabolism transcriptional repressor
MRISAKAEYACLAVLDLALLRDKREPVRVAEIADRNDIPERFLVQILLQLKGAGYVQSVRGAAGGYRLAVAPENVTLWDVVQLVDGTSALGMDDGPARQAGGWRVLKTVWQSVNRAEETKLRQTDFAKLVTQATEQEAHMFHI